MFYVRLLTDLKSCARNFTKFFKLFKPYIYTGFNSYYLIDKDSEVSFDTYKQIYKDIILSVKEVSLNYINKCSIQGILRANEFSIYLTWIISSTTQVTISTVLISSCI